MFFSGMIKKITAIFIYFPCLDSILLVSRWCFMAIWLPILDNVWQLKYEAFITPNRDLTVKNSTL